MRLEELASVEELNPVAKALTIHGCPLWHERGKRVRTGLSLKPQADSQVGTLDEDFIRYFIASQA
jgi:hypothetical protein